MLIFPPCEKKDIVSIETSKDNHRMIKIDRRKTGTAVLVPLLHEAERLISGNLTYDGQKVFKVFTNQPTNRYLKEIMTIVAIGKKNSFHCGRHTFATLCNTKGINNDIIAKYLGHTDTKTTKIYAKYETELLISEIGKWNPTK